MNYGEILSKAWQIIWKNKVLWIFGILAGCSSNPGNSSSWRESFNQNNGSAPDNFGYNFQRFFENIPPWVWVLLVIAALLFAIVAIVLVTIGRIGLIKGASEADQGAARLSFGPLFSTSSRYFWRVLLLNILVFLAMIVVGIVVAIPLALIFAGLAVTVVGLICVIPLACVLGIIAWLFTIFIEQSTVALVTEDLDVMEALRHGWQVVTRNPGQYIVMGVILGIIGFVAALVIGLPLVGLILPPLIDMALSNGQVRSGLVVSVVLFLVYLPILLFLNGILQSYITSAWTLTYRRLTGKGSPAVQVYVPPSEPTVPPAEPAPF